MQASFTPTDAVHILGKFSEFVTEAAVMGGRLLARQKTAKGTELAKDETALAHAVCEALIAQSAIALMDAAFAEDGKAEHVVSSSSLLSDQLRYGGEDADIGLLSIRLSTPLIALGASSSTHYPAIADRLQTQLVKPASCRCCRCRRGGSWGGKAEICGNCHPASGWLLQDPPARRASGCNRSGYCP